MKVASVGDVTSYSSSSEICWNLGEVSPQLLLLLLAILRKLEPGNDLSAILSVGGPERTTLRPHGRGKGLRVERCDENRGDERTEGVWRKSEYKQDG